MCYICAKCIRLECARIINNIKLFLPKYYVMFVLLYYYPYMHKSIKN